MQDRNDNDQRTARRETHDAERANWRLTERIDHEEGRGDPFAAAVRTTRMPMALTDPRQPDNPLVFVNQAFQDLTGYNRDEILGRNCRFLQGPDTDRDSVRRLRDAIANTEQVKVELLNYRKDGSTFWNELQMGPVLGKNGEVDFFFASQIDITERVDAQQLATRQEAVIEREVRRRTKEQREALERQRLLTHEVDHRVKNNLAMISALIRMEARSATEPACREAMERVQGRVDAMGATHEQLYAAGDSNVFSLSNYVAKLTEQMVTNYGRSDIDLRLDIDEGIELSSKSGAPFGLVMNEILTNALKHAYADRGGTLEVAVREEGANIVVTVADDGPGIDRSTPQTASLGRRLVERLTAQMGGSERKIDVALGTKVQVTIPKEF